jgi:hypothetical protein
MEFIPCHFHEAAPNLLPENILNPEAEILEFKERVMQVLLLRMMSW